jgi:DNA-directed RNA polymerase specialized sigma24 family protein
MSDALATALRALYAKETTFRAFYLSTRQEWRRMALALYRGFKLPPTVSVEDVEQELLLGAWQAVGRWDAAGMSLCAYVVWSAHNKATRWIHLQRQANKHTRKGPGQYAWCVASLARDGDADGSRVLENHADGKPLAEAAHDYGELLRLLPEVATTVAGHAALEHFIAAGGDAEEAARLWRKNAAERSLYQLRSQAEAKRIIANELWYARRVLLHDDGGV